MRQRRKPLILPRNVSKNPKLLTWSSVNTLKVYSSTSGAMPGQSLWDEPMTPATKEPWPKPSDNEFWCVQLVRLRMMRMCGWPSRMPVSNTPTCKSNQQLSVWIVYLAARC